MKVVIGTVLAVGIIGCGVFLLAVIVRFSIVSSQIARGAEGRLRYPNPQGIAALTAIEPSAELVDFYRNATFVESTEFYLADHSKDPPFVWSIYRFHPLTVTDVREQLKINGRVPGIPIASDGEKGVYYVGTSGAVMLDSPNVRGRRVQVAPSVGAFASFEVRAEPPEEDEDY